MTWTWPSLVANDKGRVAPARRMTTAPLSA
jgi:hypothetical protein